MKNNYFFKKLLIPLFFFLGLISFKVSAQCTPTGTATVSPYIVDNTSAVGAACLGNWTVPCGVTSVTVSLWGGGGGGGGSSTNGSGGSGGGSGAYISKTLTVVPGDVISYTIGAGGSAGAEAAGTGGNGGDTTVTFGAIGMTAGKGRGGQGNAGSTAPNNEGGVAVCSGCPAGGTVSNGNNGVTGGASGGNGGSSPSGGGGGTGNTNDHGGNGTAPGGGGGGGERDGGTSKKGGVGAGGRVMFVFATSGPEIDVQGGSPLVSIVDGDVTPTTTDYTDMGTGASLTKTFTIVNSGGTDLTLTLPITFSGADAANFAISSAPPATVPACGGSVQFDVTFTQGGNYAHNAIMTITNSDSDEGTYDFALTAMGVPPAPEIEIKGNSNSILSGDVTPMTSDFTDFGTLNTRDFYIHNLGLADLSLTGSKVTIGGADAAFFSVTRSPSATITTGSSDYFTITFAPTAIRVYNATITVTSNDADEASYTFAVMGTGISPEIQVSDTSGNIIVNGDVTPSTLDGTDFGTIYIGTSWVKTFRVSNLGTLPLSLTGTPRVSKSGSANFTVFSPSSVSIAGNSYIEFDVSYTPNAVATDTADLSISNADTDENPSTFRIQGTGVNGTITPMPGCLGGGNPSCNNSSNSSFTGAATGWTMNNWTYGSNMVEYNDNAVCACTNGSLSQTITGLTAASTTILVKFKIKMQVQSCNMTGRSFDFNLGWNGTTYLTARLEDTQQDAYFILQNGGILVATDATSIKTNFTPAGCSAAGGPDTFTTVYVSVPKAAGATTGDISFSIVNPGESGTSKIHQLHLFLDDIELTADSGACGFLWLKADAGTSTTTEAAQISQWNDNSIQGKHATQGTGTKQPLYNASVLNFNPGVYFDGSNDFLSGTGGYSSGTQLIVFKSPAVITNASASQTLIGVNLTSNASDLSGFKLGAFSATISSETFGILRGTSAAGYSQASRNAFSYLGNIVTGRSNNTSPPNGWFATLNGTSGGTMYTGGTGYLEWANTPYVLAASPDQTYTSYSQFYQGHILEVCTYPTKLSNTEYVKVLSYLAMKYGLTINSNYTRGSGSTIYYITGYANRIISLAREDCQALHQRQGKSEHATAANDLFTLGYNSTIGTTNSSANGNDLPDNTFIIMGDDNGSIASWTATGAPVAALPESTKVSRIWKIQSTGTITSPTRFRLDGTKLPAPIGGAERIALVFNSTTNFTGATFNGATSVIVPMSLYGTNWECDFTLPSGTVVTRYMSIIKYNDCYSDLLCISGDTTWNGAAWSNGSPNQYKRAILSGNYDTGVNGDFHCCRLQIDNGFTLTIDDGGLIETEADVTNNGAIVIANNGSLMQYADSSVNSGSGTLSMTRTSVPMYVGDYTYWSSPVVGFNLSGIPKNRAYYRSASDNEWKSASGIMQPGFGYIAMTDNTSKTVSAATSVTFTGTMNNGRIIQPVVINKSKWNLLGNPYPSALDASDFVTDNTTISGSLYFWTHNTRISLTNTVSSGLKGFFTQNDYAVWNNSGGTAAAATIGSPVTDAYANVISAGGNSAAPTGEIAAGQAFFVEALSASNVTFKNCQRTMNPGLNNNFYKSANSIQKDRFWLDIANDSGAFKQMLVGYFDGATDGNDRLYDAKLRNGDNKVAIYSNSRDNSTGEDYRYSIEGKATPFKDTDVVNLGITLRDGAGAGNVIALSKTEGIFNDKAIYLVDKLVGVTHNLKDGYYKFESTVGDHEDRFEIRYQNISTSEMNEIISGVSVATGSGKISVRTKDSAINTIKIYNVLGGLIYETEVGGTSQIHDVPSVSPRNQVLIVVTTLANGQKSTSKIIF